MKIIWTPTGDDFIRVTCPKCSFTKIVTGRAEGRRLMYAHEAKAHRKGERK